jgi:hypothetical protein
MALVLLIGAVSPSAAMAQRDQQERDIIDARLEGYASGGQPVNVTLPPSSVGLTWVALVVLGAICVGGLFKDAKRSHLD